MTDFTDRKLKICFIGSGAITTSMGNVISLKNKYDVTLLSVEEDVVRSINEDHVNRKYFPNVHLHPSLTCTSDRGILRNSDLVFLGIPSNVVVSYVRESKELFNPNSLVVNLAKGFGMDHKTIPQGLSRTIDNPIFSMKGPSFAREIINNLPTGFTLVSKRERYFKIFEEIFDGTSIYLDYSNDVYGVELASILKNIYAIIIGIVDAHFDSPNLRSLVITKSINEIRFIMTRVWR